MASDPDEGRGSDGWQQGRSGGCAEGRVQLQGRALPLEGDGVAAARIASLCCMAELPTVVPWWGRVPRVKHCARLVLGSGGGLECSCSSCVCVSALALSMTRQRNDQRPKVYSVADFTVDETCY